MQITDYMERHSHEQLVVCYEPSVGLKAFIAIHDTTLGPACEGVRVWDHATEEDAIMDVLRLARAMTYKSAVTGLPLGGGKALIWADPRTDKNEAMMRAFGRYVDTLGFDDTSPRKTLAWACWTLSTSLGRRTTLPACRSRWAVAGTPRR